MKKQNRLGSLIMLARKTLGIRQEELAQKMNCTNRTIQLWESGTITPSIPKIVALAKHLRKEVSFFLPPDITDDVEKLEIYLPSATVSKLRRRAKKEHLSVSDFIRQTLEKALTVK